MDDGANHAGDRERVVDRRLRRTEFDNVDLGKAHFTNVNLAEARFHNVRFSGSTMRGVLMTGVSLDGDIGDMVVNDVEIAPLVEAELDRRDPDRARVLRPDDADEFREAWAIVGRRWDTTVARARQFEPAHLHESVDGEWSFIETLRHLVFATDTWLHRAILGDPRPWHPLGLPFDEMQPHPEVPWDRDVRPTLDEALALRAQRRGAVGDYLADLDDATLAGHTEPVEGPSWPPPDRYPVRECLRILLSEEWHHRLYAERDLAALEDAQSSRATHP